MAVLNDSEGALVPRNGANGVNGTDGGLSVTRRPAMSAFTLPRSVPAKTLVNPKTVSTLTQAFNFSNIINKHSLHERELREVEDEKLDFRSEEYMTTILNLKMTQDDKYVGYMNFRGKISNHLQAALAESDELLQSLADLTENLSVAQYEKELANEGRKAAEKVRDQLQEELNTLSCELTRARLQMIQLLRERDDESVKAQAARNLLIIRDKQIEVLQEDVTRLQKVVDSLTKKHGEAVDAFRKAQMAERQAAQEAEQQYATVQRLKTEKQLTRADIDVLTSQFSEAQAKLESELAVMEGEVATLRVEQLGWDGERSQYLQSIAKEKSASQKAAFMNTELDEKLRVAQFAQEELKEAHTAAMKERDEIEKALKDKFEADLQRREEAEKGLREKIVAGLIEYEDKVKELQDKFQLELQKLQDEEKALKHQRDAEIRKREEEKKTHEQQLQAERAEFEVKRQELIEQGKKNEEELREMHLKKDSGRRGHSHKHAWIQDIFLGNQRLDEQKKTHQEIYNEIGARFSTHEPLHLENIFPDKSDKKKSVVVVYNFHGDETPRILTAAADGILKFPKP